MEFYIIFLILLFVNKAKSVEYKRFTPECIVKGTNERGFYKLIRHCPRIKEEVRKGAPFPKVCNYQVCRDLVCCPVGGLKRTNEVCNEYDDASYAISQRITQGNYCTVNGKSGVYKFKYQCKIKNQILCEYDFCKSFVCCPIADVLGQTLEYNTKFHKMTGGSCVDGITGEAGICKPQEQCDYISSNKRRTFTSCGFEFCTEFICCPIQKSYSKSQEACQIYKEAVFESARKVKNLRSTKDPKLICSEVSPSGGWKASPKQFPNIAALGYQQRNESIIWNCGGSLISNRFILTAAHCVNSGEFGPVKFVRLGALTINQPDKMGCPEEYKVIQRILHPRYDVNLRYNDIALLKLDRIVKFTPHIRPACLPTEQSQPNDMFFGMGWGQTGFAAPKTDWLVFVNIKEFNNRFCNRFFENAPKLPNGIIEKTQLCAVSEYLIDDTCPGDSGGPIQSNKFYEMADIHGITSFGNACGFKNSPSVYTRVFPYVKWIERIVWKN